MTAYRCSNCQMTFTIKCVPCGEKATQPCPSCRQPAGKVTQ